MLLQAHNISKSFGSRHVLDAVSFTLDSGEALGVLGANGAGTTTAACSSTATPCVSPTSAP